MSGLLGDQLRDWLERADLEIATDCDSVRSASFLEAAHRRAREFSARGAPGSRVAVEAGRGLCFWIDLVGAWMADRVVVPVPSKPCAALKTAVAEALAHSGQGEAAVWFTSGSTGTPKGARLSAEGLLSNATSAISRLGLPKGARLFVPVPFTFVSSLSHFLVALGSGASFLGREKTFFPGAFLKEVLRVEADALGGAPVHLRWILESDREWRWLMASGDRLSPEVVRALRVRFPKARLNIVYGMTELSGRAFSLSDEEADEAPETVGEVLPPLSVRIDEVTREVQFQGPSVMLGYVGRGREGFTQDGWLGSGDLGEWDSQGRLTLLGRRDDVFKCAGNKVSTFLIADALWKTGDFRDVAVVGREHPQLGHVPHAYVVPLSADWDSASTLGKLRAYLAPDHLPHGFTSLTSLPRTGSGKLERRKLAESSHLG